MTGREVLEQAAGLLGYGQPAEGGGSRGLLYVNKIAEELWDYTGGDRYLPVSSPDEPLPPLAREQALPFGVAMLLAQAAGDGDNQALYGALYDRRRAAALSGERRDVLPR